MQLNRLSLSFTESCRTIEAPFLESYFKQSIAYIRRWHIVAGIAYASSGIIEGVFIPEMAVKLWLIRFGLVIPLLAASLFFTFSRFYVRYWQVLCPFLVMVIGISLIITMVITSVPQNRFYFYCLMVTLFCGYTSYRCRFIHASITGWLLVTIYGIVTFHSGQRPYPGVGVDFYLLIIVNFLGMAITRSMEVLARKDFHANETLRKQNRRLTKENANCHATEDKLIASLREKEMLFREVNHRVKNNLQIISSLLDMTRNRSADPAVKDSLIGARTKIQTMAMIHTRLYENYRIEKIDMEQQIRELYSNLYMLYGEGRGIQFELDAADIHMNVAKAIPCALILNELISNTMKHAFQSETEPIIVVSIHFTKQDRVELIVRDNGSGLPVAINFYRADTLGLKLVRILAVEQLGGELEILREQGTTFFLRFNIDE
jgi:two-component sensor histidine kinase